MKKYYPYKSDKPDKKYFIYTCSGARVYFGATDYENYTDGHFDERRRAAYKKRHANNENWTKTGVNTPGFWSWHYLWELPSKKQALQNIKNKYLDSKYATRCVK